MLLTPHLISWNKQGQARTLSKPQFWGPKVGVIARSECTFRRITIKGKGAKALQAARLQLKHEALTQESYIQILRDKSGSGAGVWTFELRSGFEGRYLPESLAVKPLDSGARLLETMSGYEGQAWANATLISSRWWAQKPSHREWSLFLRAAQIDEMPDAASSLNPISVPLRDNISAWDLSPERVMKTFSPLRLLWTLGLAGVVMSCFYGAQFAHYSLRLGQAKVEIAGITDSAQLVLSQRRRALKNVQDMKNIQGSGDEALILTALYGLTDELSDYGLKLYDFRVSEGLFKATLRGDLQLTVPQIVTRLEAVPVFSNVTASFNARGVLEIETALLPFKTNATLNKVQRKQSEPAGAEQGETP